MAFLQGLTVAVFTGAGLTAGMVMANLFQPPGQMTVGLAAGVLVGLVSYVALVLLVALWAWKAAG